MKKIAAVLVLFLAACSDPHKTPLPPDAATWSDKLATDVLRLAPEERKVFFEFARRRVAADSRAAPPADPAHSFLAAANIGDAIEAQRAWEAMEGERQAAQAKALVAMQQRMARARAAEQARLANEKAGAERASAAAAKILSVVVRVAAAAPEPNDGTSDRQMFILEFTNKSDKDIAGVEGGIRFEDPQGALLTLYRFRFLENIPAGRTVAWTRTLDLNNPSDVGGLANRAAFARIKNGNYRSEFVPGAIVFNDNTRLDAAQMIASQMAAGDKQ
jgi:hypothetical protein